MSGHAHRSEMSRGAQPTNAISKSMTAPSVLGGREGVRRAGSSIYNGCGFTAWYVLPRFVGLVRQQGEERHRVAEGRWSMKAPGGIWLNC
jgi:hypothetical protein